MYLRCFFTSFMVLLSLLYLFSCSSKHESYEENDTFSHEKIINNDTIISLIRTWYHVKTIYDKETSLKEEVTKLIFNEDSTYNYIIDYNYVKLDRLTNKGKWILKSDNYILLKPNNSEEEKSFKIIKLSHDSLILKGNFEQYKEVIIYMISKRKRIDKTK